METARSATRDRSAWQAWHGPDEDIRLGISSCLLGEAVRFDGGHKHDRYLTGVLGQWVTWVPVCPEVDIGLPTPRPSIRLEKQDGASRLVNPRTGEDLTERMRSYSEEKVTELQELNLDGYVLKRASPSCGMERLKVYPPGGGSPDRNGVGVYAEVLMRRWPGLPVEEEGRLNDPVLRENFIERVFCRHRWRNLVAGGLSRARLVEFHTAHKLLLRSHNEAGYRRLGRIVAAAGSVPDAEMYTQYETELHATLATRTTTKRHVNVLYHILGYLKKVIGPDDKQEVIGLIEDYRNGLLPLVVPVTLLRHHVHRHDVRYMLGQLYLEPHPKELMLRNRV
jgi:uncharacterized protein YbgA (DUF1722 family)/uncharacterized protein YbbK (DUF523 family)